MRQYQLISKWINTSVVIVVTLLMISNVAKADMLAALTTDDVYAGPTVEERIALMDKDKNGFADVHEIRQFLESQHGKDYKQDLLARLEANAVPQSCGTSVAELLTEE